MAQWVNRLRNNIFVNPPPLPLLCGRKLMLCFLCNGMATTCVYAHAYSVITAVPMHLSKFFQLKPIVRWVFRVAKKPDSIHSLSIPTIKYPLHHGDSFILPFFTFFSIHWNA